MALCLMAPSHHLNTIESLPMGSAASTKEKFTRKYSRYQLVTYIWKSDVYDYCHNAQPTCHNVLPLFFKKPGHVCELIAIWYVLYKTNINNVIRTQSYHSIRPHNLHYPCIPYYPMVPVPWGSGLIIDTIKLMVSSPQGMKAYWAQDKW